VRFNNEYSAYLYLLSFVFFGSILLMNLFLGIIFYNFTTTRRAALHKHLTDSQQMWIDLVHLVAKTPPDYNTPVKRKSRISSICSKLLAGGILKFTVLTCTGMSLSFLIIWRTYYGEKNGEIIKYFNFLTSCLNIAEFFIRTFAVGPKLFLTHPWNQFDFLIITVSSIEIFPILFDLPLEINDFLSAIGVLRIFRFLTLFPQYSGVKKLLMTLAYSFPIVFNLFIVLLLILFIYSMAGYIFFSGFEFGNDISFKNFYLALVTLLKIATGDEWVEIMIRVKLVTGMINLFV
jgi:hypothetical protein